MRIFAITLFLFTATAGQAQWIRPEDHYSPAVWGIRNGIVVSIWPYGVEGEPGTFGGGPRGLLRIGLQSAAGFHLLNFIAIEPMVNGKIEYSEVSPSGIDQQWGKLLWASDDSTQRTGFFPTAISRGTISHPDPAKPDVEELSVFLHMEKFQHGAHPFLQLLFRSDRPLEVGIRVYNHAGSATMDRCAITATMGNYARLRWLYLNKKKIESDKLYKGFNGIDFVEKEAYKRDQLIKTANGSWLAAAATNENFASLAAWPQTPDYQRRVSWRYRLPFALMQYWRRDASADPSLKVRVNGRAKYWAGGTNDASKYINIPGGVAFENFEMQENYQPGQTFYFGFHTGTLDQLIQSF